MTPQSPRRNGCAFRLVLCIAAGLGSLPVARAAGSAESAPPFFEGLGAHTRKITTVSPSAQRYFDQGMAFLNGFNHAEALRSFQQAAQLDPSSAMAWWGIALACGPDINAPMVPPDRSATAWNALKHAQEASPGCTQTERSLISAQARRFANPQPNDRSPLDRAYADAMREVWLAHPTDADVGALFAEALLDLRPWDQWTATGDPQPGTEEVVATLRAVLKLDPRHPLANHLWIHALEASPHPEQADSAADMLRELQPGVGHIVHMPSHIDVRCGRWEEAIIANEKAIQADDHYRDVSGKPLGFYRFYMAHNAHMLVFAAMMSGRSELAIRHIRAMVADMPAGWVKENAPYADPYVSMPYEVLVRFGKWDEILAEPEAAEYLPISRALRLATRGIAFTAKGNLADARVEQEAYLKAVGALAPNLSYGENMLPAVLAVATHMLSGELLYREGKIDEGLVQLREAVKSEDALRYDEPPDWILPARHALGAALLEAGRTAEAEQVYRADLARLPDNGWSLFGLARCLQLENKPLEAAPVETRFEKVWAKADLQLSSSCLCRAGGR